MKKEVLIAIIIGFGLGLVITFGVWSANKNFNKVSPAEPVPTTIPNLSPSPTDAPELALEIDSPEDDFLSNEDAIEIAGRASPGGIIVLLYPKGEKILQAEENGSFSTEIVLAGGANEIRISAFDESGNEVEKILNVVYSTAEI